MSFLQEVERGVRGVAPFAFIEEPRQSPASPVVQAAPRDASMLLGMRRRLQDGKSDVDGLVGEQRGDGCTMVYLYNV